MDIFSAVEWVNDVRVRHLFDGLLVARGEGGDAVPVAVHAVVGPS